MAVDGLLIINKATGMTSHDVVAEVRKILHQKRVGHAGTLDPAASGVLPICVGQGTRVAEYLSESGKAYQAEITFGVVTDTYDIEGTVIRTADTTGLTQDQIEAQLAHFLGPQMQMPPLYSAIKIQGQPAYKRLRAGEVVELDPRPIEIFHLHILAWLPPRLTLAIECSKGTYIRSLAYDLGEQLGCGGYLTSLIRTRSGPFSLTDSISLEQLAEAVTQDTIAHHLFSPDSALLQYPALSLDDTTAQRVLHGNAFAYHDDNFVVAELARVYDVAGNFLAIATWDAEQGLWQPKKVLVER